MIGATLTTPHQGLPPNIQTLLGMGAYQIGGGPQNFGQGVNENFVRNLIAGAGTAIWSGAENVAGIIDNVAQWLGTLPLEALKMFRYFIPGAVPDEFIDIATSVSTIINALSLQRLMMSLDDFEAWLSSTYNILLTEVHQLFDAIGGLIVTPITTRVGTFIDWLASLVGFQTDTTAGLTTIGGYIDELIFGVGGEAIGDVVSAIGHGVQAGVDIAQILTEAGIDTIAALVELIIQGVTALGQIAEIISGIGGSNPADVVGAIESGVDALSQIGELITGLGGTVVGDVVDLLNGYTDSIADAVDAATDALADAAAALLKLVHVDASGIYDAAAGFNNLATSLLKHLTPTGGNIGQFDAGYITGPINTAVTIGGQAISSIFNGSGHFIGQISSAATGALNGAVTLGGTALSALSTNWNAAVTNINNLIGGVTGASTPAQVAAAINNAGTNITQIGTAAQNAAAGIVGSLNIAAMQVQTAFSGVLAGLFGAVNNVPASAASQSSANTAVSNLTASALAAAAATSSLQASLALTAAPAAPNLQSVTINFNAYPNSAGLPAVFTQTNPVSAGPGTFGIVNGVAKWSSTSGATGILSQGIYNVADTASDYQVITATLAGAPTGDAFCRLSLLGRVNAAGTTMVRFRINGGGGVLEAVVAGVVTGLAVATAVLNPTATYTLECGIPNSGVVKFRVLCNGTPIFLSPYVGMGTVVNGVFTETAGVSQYGASYRKSGFDNLASSGDGPTVYQWTRADNPFVAGGAASAFVSTSQNSTSTTYAALATALSVTATIGSSGMALVLISSNLQNNTQASRSYMSYAVSGATTKAAADDHCIAIGIPAAVADMGYFSGAFLETGLTPGSNTFAAQHRVSATTGTFQNRRISVIPL